MEKARRIIELLTGSKLINGKKVKVTAFMEVLKRIEEIVDER